MGTSFLFFKYIIFFSIILPILFSGKQNKKKVTGHSFYEVFELENILTLSGNRQNNCIIFMSSLHNLLAGDQFY